MRKHFLQGNSRPGVDANRLRLFSNYFIQSHKKSPLVCAGGNTLDFFPNQ